MPEVQGQPPGRARVHVRRLRSAIRRRRTDRQVRRCRGAFRILGSLVSRREGDGIPEQLENTDAAGTDQAVRPEPAGRAQASARARSRLRTRPEHGDPAGRRFPRGGAGLLPRMPRGRMPRDSPGRDADVCFVQADLNDTFFVPDSTDVLLMADFLQHLGPEAVQRRFLRNAFEALRPGGRFYLSFFNTNLKNRLKSDINGSFADGAIPLPATQRAFGAGDAARRHRGHAGLSDEHLHDPSAGSTGGCRAVLVDVRPHVRAGRREALSRAGPRG